MRKLSNVRETSVISMTALIVVLVLFPSKAQALPAGWTCIGTLGWCRKVALQSPVMGELEGTFDLVVSAGNGFEPDPSTVVLEWFDFQAVGTFQDGLGNNFPTSILLNDDFGVSTATIISLNPEGAPPVSGPLVPSALQYNSYFFEFTVSTPFGPMVLVNEDPWLMEGELFGWPPGSTYPATYTQISPVDLILESGPLEITQFIPPGSIFGTASGAEVVIPEPATFLMLGLGGLVLRRKRRAC